MRKNDADNYHMMTTAYRRASGGVGLQMIMELPTPSLDMFPKKLRKGDTRAVNGGEPLRVSFVRRARKGDTVKIHLRLEVIE
jgi:hypothetical protein